MEATWYLVGPAGETGNEIKGIAVLTGDVRFTDPETSVGTYHLVVYATGSNPSMVPTDGMPIAFDSDSLPDPIVAANNIVF